MMVEDNEMKNIFIDILVYCKVLVHCSVDCRMWIL